MAETKFLMAPRRAAAPRHPAPARLTWKDASGAVRMVSVVAHCVDDERVTVDCETSIAIPLYRLVHLQLEARGSGAETWPVDWRHRRLLSAVWQVGPCRPTTGTPSGYGLRVLEVPAAEDETLLEAS
ncbi:MAG: hypothetical protein AB7O67_11830 [Vicinamibacterales bacterium]